MSHPLDQAQLPLLLAGPILRRATPEQCLIWVATSKAVEITGELKQADQNLPATVTCQSVRISDALHIHLVEIAIEAEIAPNIPLSYQLFALDQDGSVTNLVTPVSDNVAFSFRPCTEIRKVLHGSCRKPHHQQIQQPYADGLSRAAQYLRSHKVEQWPDVLILSGDQIYADDVAGPMLRAIHQVITLLGLPDEELDSLNNHLTGLHTTATYLYRREELLPSSEGKLSDEEVKRQFFGGVKKPIFSSDNAHNHLISFAEVMAMYLLCWSPTLWHWVDLSAPEDLAEEYIERYNKERTAIEDFKRGLKDVAEVLARLPTAMMFDDHDITDDWNLTAEWELMAYGHPLSKRIIGNALMGYFLCQGWGNAPEAFDSTFHQRLQLAIGNLGKEQHDDFIEQLLKFDQWHYQWQTTPKLVVLDTRTHRWRSESNFGKPSGLMDWEALTDLQQAILGEQAVILVSPAPVFGVKLIEAIQRLFTWIGKPLLVDAENWMAHPGAAHALLNIFKHPKTPQNFLILSGDVHYSFVYDIAIRSKLSSPDIWQVTSSGIRNEFPAPLLTWFDHLNRWLYAPWSPLNVFTKRRDMRVVPRKPEFADNGERLLNHAGIGLIELDEHGKPTRIAQLCTSGATIHFDHEQH